MRKGMRLTACVLARVHTHTHTHTHAHTHGRSFPERVALDFFRQTCAGLDYLHYNGVVHGDLKVRIEHCVVVPVSNVSGHIIPL